MLQVDTFDNAKVNLAVLGEVALAILIARGGVLSSLLGIERLTPTQWPVAAIPAVATLVLWGPASCSPDAVPEAGAGRSHPGRGAASEPP